MNRLVERAGGPRRLIQAALSLIVVVAIFVFALPQLADFGEVWAQITAMTAIELTALLAVAVWNIASYWLVMIVSLPGSNVWQALKVNGASTAITNTLPGGSALGIGVTFGMYLSYGFKRGDVGRAVLVSGVWNNFVKLGMPVVALALLALHGGASTATLTASLAGLAMLAAAVLTFGLVLHSESLARRVGSRLGRVRDRFRRLLRKEPGGDMAGTTARFRLDTIELLSTRWAWLSLATLVSHLSLFLVLLLSLRFVGVSAQQVAWQEILAAFAFVRLISALPITPGGLGVVELGYAAALVAAGGDRPTVLAGVLMFRALTYLLPIPWGMVTYLRWRQGAERRKLRVAAAKRAELEVEANPPVASDQIK